MVRAALETLRRRREGELTLAHAIGFLLMEPVERRTDLRHLLGRLKRLLRGDYPVDGSAGMLSADLEDPEAASREEIRDVQRLLEEPHSLRWRLAALLGNLFMTCVMVVIYGDRWRGWRAAGKSGRRPPLARLEQPFVPLAAPPEPPPPLGFTGPDWLVRLMEAEGLAAANGGPVLVAVSGDAGRDALRELRGPRAVWLLDGPPDAELGRLLRRDDRVFVADASWRAALGRAAAVLPPAVQPRLQNPFGRWYTSDAWSPPVTGLPEPWARQQEVAAGRAPRHETFEVPRWADEAWRVEAERFVQMRRTLREETLAHRLAAVRGALGLPTGGGEAPLVSVLLSTNRPERAIAALESIRRQRWPHRELVMVLHGPGFDLPPLERALEGLELPFRVVRVPAERSLGYCYQVGARECRGRYVAIMDDDNWFGPRYVEDAVLWMESSGALVGGKFTLPVFFEENAALHLILRGREFRRMQPSSAQAVFRRELLELLPWRDMAAGADTHYFDDCIRMGVPMVTFDRYNFAYCRGPRRHTYEVSQEELLRIYKGLPLGCPAQPSDCDV